MTTTYPSPEVSEALKHLKALEQQITILAQKMPEISQARHHLAEIRDYIRAFEAYENRKRFHRNRLAADIAAAEQMRELTNGSS